ncbi:MAG: PilZ domain-containing protein [Sphingomonas sp.]|uniref:PilZ domain-containing protein n=1 Tax=Sphingomonas sp. TaxID=28214 RepID=UPI00121107E2|nr:PilZ domain-containing protein [Sphingomonas sp.]THD34433.1 MAG: PilZ domain-containing protein [Sphingomonas sp.]
MTVHSVGSDRAALFDRAIGDQRAELRHRTVLQVARLATARGDELCILRNVSAGGLRADIYCALAVGETVEFELRTGRRIAGRVIWAEGGSIGVKFDRKVPILAYLAHQTLGELGRRVRAPRVQLNGEATVRVTDREFAVHIADASQAGMCIKTDRLLLEGASCDINAAGLDERGAIVRWCRDGAAGLQFKRPLSFREFAAWRTRGRAPQVLN